VSDQTDKIERVSVQKTYKLYIGGAFPRSESGRYLPMNDAEGHFVANISRASRKDFRASMTAARAAQHGWAKRSAFNRGQILYRMAEMLESRRGVFEAQLRDIAGSDEVAAKNEVDAAVDRLVWYAGWSDKFQQVIGSTNPVATAHFNFTVPEATGVVAILASRQSSLLALVSAFAPVIVSGNTCVVIVDTKAPTVAIELAEVLATSDLPGGVVNILTGQRSELVGQTGGHMDVDAVFAIGSDDAERKTIATDAAESVKRTFFVDDATPAEWRDAKRQSPYWILPFVELKTAWHPIGV